MAIPRRKIDEVVLRYRLEPSLDDVFVEGDYDKRVFDRAFQERGISRPVYCIDTVDIDFDLLAKHGLSEGRKQRVVALSKELDKEATKLVAFCIDADLDRHRGELIDDHRIRYSKYCDIDCVFFTYEILKDVISGAAGVLDSHFDEFYDSVNLAVRSLFSVRMAMSDLSIQTSLPEVTKSLERTGFRVSLDINHFCGRLGLPPLVKSELVKQAQVRLAQFEPFDVRECGRGHDFKSVYSWATRKIGTKPIIGDALPEILILFVSRVVDDLLAPVTGIYK